MKKLLRLVIIILITVTLLLLMGSALVVFILSPSRLTPLVNKYANQFLNAYVHVEEVSVQPLKNFPHISLILKNGILLVPDAEQDTDKTDTLVAFRQLRAVLQPVSLLKNHLHLSRLSLEKATVRLYKNKDGIANWAIFPESEDTLSSGFSFSIGRLTVRDTLHVTFDNREDSLFFQTNIGNMAVRTSRRHSGYHTRIDSYSNTLITGKTRFLDHIPFLINGNITFDSNFDKFLFTDCQGTLDEVPYYLNMSLEMHPDSLELHGTLRLDTVLVTRLLHACPPFLLPFKTTPTTNIPVAIQCTLDGAYCYESGELPPYNLNVYTGKGHFLLPEKNLSFSSFQTSFTASYNPREKDLGTLQLHTLDLKSRELELQAGGKLLSYTNDPLLDLSAKALIHAENLSAFIQDEPEHNMQGSVSMDIQARGKIRDLNPEGLKNIQLLSHISTPGFTLDLPRNNIFCKADSTELYLNISETKPLTGSLKTKRLQLVLSDSTRLHLQRGDVSLTMNSHEPDPGIPFMHLQLNARSAGGVYGIHRGTLRGLKIQAAVTQTPERQRRTATTDTARRRTADSTRQRNVADTTRRRTAFAGNFMPRRTRHEFSFADLQFNFGFTPETRELLRKWQVNGTLQTTSAQVITPIYPLRTRLHSVHLELQDNLLKIHNMSIKSGHSDLRLSGQLNGIRRALTGKAQLNLYLEIQGDTLEGNELLHAIAAGTEILSQQDSAGLKQLRKAAASESDTQLEHIITQAAVERKAYEDLIIIPGNVNMQVILQVSNAYYRHLHLQDVSGSLLATDRRLHVKDMQATSNAGSFFLNALYATPHKDSLMAGVDLEMQDVLLEEVTQLLPSMDTLFPMMSSFRGLVDLQLAVMSQLDTSMNLILPTLHGACRIRGDGLVLLDGETFSEISRKLFFKKRALNLIDSIRVEATISDSRVDVFPFIMQMDRYKVALAGSHHMDQTFHYHISLLKSPLPFRLGIDVVGTPEKYKITPGRIRFTDEKLPALSYRIDTIRINLREQIIHYFETHPVKNTYTDF